MTWRHLAFLHWPVAPGALRPHVPAALELETFQGSAWLTVSPLSMTGVRPRFLPALPPYGFLREVNLRTYVRFENKPGIWFFSLDASSRVAVWAARLSFSLPYFPARISMSRNGEAFRCVSRRLRPRSPSAGLELHYRSRGPAYRAEEGSLDRWLTARYCMYSADRRGRLWRGEIHHRDWPLEPAEIRIVENTLHHPLGIDLPPAPPRAQYARELSVLAWAPEGL